MIKTNRHVQFAFCVPWGTFHIRRMFPPQRFVEFTLLNIDGWGIELILWRFYFSFEFICPACGY